MSFSGFYHLKKFTYLSVAKKSLVNTIDDMAKIQIKSYKVTPFGPIFSTIEKTGFTSTMRAL